MQRRARILTAFAAAFCLGVWLGSMAHALSVAPESTSTGATCCRTLKRVTRSTEIHSALSATPCLLCQLASAPVTTALANVPTCSVEFELASRPSFALKTSPALLYYAPRGRAPPVNA